MGTSGHSQAQSFGLVLILASLLASGCKSSGSQFTYADPKTISPALIADTQSNRLPDRNPNETRKSARVAMASPEESGPMKMWAKPSMNPYDRQVDPRLYDRKGSDVDRLKAEEKQIMQAQGLGDEGQAGVSFTFK